MERKKTPTIDLRGEAEENGKRMSASLKDRVRLTGVLGLERRELCKKNVVRVCPFRSFCLICFLSGFLHLASVF